MRVILVVGGALFGLAFANGSVGLFGTAFGALVGYLVAELIASRTRISEIEKEVDELRRRAIRDDAKAAAAQAASREPRAEGADPYSNADRAADAAAARAAPGDIEGAAAAVSDGPSDAAAVPAQPHSQTPSPAPSWSAQAPAHGSMLGSAPGSQAVPPETPARPAHASAHATGPVPAGTEPRTARPAPPRDTPNKEPAMVRIVREYFTGGNTVVRVGIVILFIGMAFLLRYVAEHTNVPIEFRLSGVAIVGVVLLALGWRLRKKRAGYALALQGGAIGILYLTVFTALRLFHVLRRARHSSYSF